MLTRNGPWSFGLLLATSVWLLSLTSPLQAGKGDKKPPQDDPPPDISYSIRFLGTLGGARSWAEAMNELGDVVGESLVDDGTTKAWPFVYFRDTDTMVDLRSLLSPADVALWRWDLFRPTGINIARQICGQGMKHNEFGVLQPYAVRITLPQQPGDSALVEVIPPPDEATAWWAEDINEFGDISGGYELPSGLRRVFAYSDGSGPVDVGTLGGAIANGLAINNHGEIAGYSENADGDRHAFVFVPGEGLEDLGVIRATRSSSFSYGDDLNDSAVVVGESTAGRVKGSTVNHAFREAGAGMQDLGTLDGDLESGATSINSGGEIVGWSLGPNDVWRGFLYTPEFGMLDLNALIDNLPAGAGNIRRWGIGNNDAGEICGAFWLQGSTQAFLLIPNR